MSDKLPEPHILLEFFHAKKVRNDCEVCGHHQWGMVGEPLRIPTTQRSPASGVDAGITTIAVGCSNCGNLRFFPLGVIEEWQKKRG